MTYADDLEVFMNDGSVSIGDLRPLQWWCLPEQRQRYPRLSRMAIDIFTIPPSSAEPERSFSHARRTQSWERLRLSAGNLEILECIGNWLQNGLIDQKKMLFELSEVEEMEIVLAEIEEM